MQQYGITMGKVGRDLVDKIETLQEDYGKCKINTQQFQQGLKDLGINTVEEIEFNTLIAEDCRFEYKMDKCKLEEKKKN